MTSSTATSRPSKTRSILASTLTIIAVVAAFVAIAYNGTMTSPTSQAQTPTQQITQLWNTFQSAAGRGDYAAVKATMTSQAATVVDGFGGAALMANFKPNTLVSIKVHGDTAKVMERRADGSTHTDLFVKTGDGWKIGIDMSQIGSSK